MRKSFTLLDRCETLFYDIGNSFGILNHKVYGCNKLFD